MKKNLIALTVIFLSFGCNSNKETYIKSYEKLELPQYSTLFSVDLFSVKGKFGEVLIPTLSKDVQSGEREKIFRGIMKSEGWVSISAFSSEEAYKANSSESFSKQHPNALKDGFLGGINEKGKYYE